MMNILSACSILVFGFLLVYSDNDNVRETTIRKPELSMNLSHNECVNCSLYSGKCTVNTHGWKAFRMSKKDRKLVVNLTTFKDGEASLARCILDGYAIIGEIETYICFWAPYMGCQGVASKHFINKHHMHHIICQRCAKYCGCKLEIGSEVIKAAKLSIICSILLCFSSFFALLYA